MLFFKIINCRWWHAFPADKFSHWTWVVILCSKKLKLNHSLNLNIWFFQIPQCYFFLSVYFHAALVVVVLPSRHVQLFVTPWAVAYQAPLSMGFSRQEYWCGLPFVLLWGGEIAYKLNVKFVLRNEIDWIGKVDLSRFC